MEAFRAYLQKELLARCRKNPRYSLRSFARSLGVNHGLLSMVLRDKRPLTPDLVRKLATPLGVSKKELDRFLSGHADGRSGRNEERERIQKFNQLSVDTFSIISDWYHDAILELARIPGFEGAPKPISKRLGITVNEARFAIERLVRVGLMKYDSNGFLVESAGDTATTLDVDQTSIALRHLQRQALMLSARALDNVPKADRDHSCLTMAVSKNDLQEAKNRIRAFRHELMAFLQRPGVEYDEVYQLGVSLYPLTTRTKTKE
jgi:uncharacterized protein (TIGR02147 family)